LRRKKQIHDGHAVRLRQTIVVERLLQLQIVADLGDGSGGWIRDVIHPWSWFGVLSAKIKASSDVITRAGYLVSWSSIHWAAKAVVGQFARASDGQHQFSHPTIHVVSI
jgi:hypothetical protein